jgi:prepilin-type N-terminal cleavage/methylation domain-containing protein
MREPENDGIARIMISYRQDARFWLNKRGDSNMNGTQLHHRRGPWNGDGSGFTLIELLVVIAVIAVLASLLLPTLARAKGAAHRAACVSNLKQIGIASAMYIGDFGAYPAHFENSGGAGSNRYWPDFLRPYVSSGWVSKVYQCPGNRENVETGTGPKGGRDVYYHFRSYDMNGFGVGRNSALGLQHLLSNPASLRGCKESEVVNPGEMISYGDAILRYGTTVFPQLGVPEYFQSRSSLTDKEKSLMRHRHNRLWNIVFSDGHVEGLTEPVLFGSNKRVESEESNRRRWNRDNSPHWEQLF